MARAELGTSRFCSECSTKFYDLNRNPAICPKCMAENDFLVSPVKEAEIQEPKPSPETPKAKSSPSEGLDSKEKGEEEILVEDIDIETEALADDVVGEDSFLSEEIEDLKGEKFVKEVKGAQEEEQESSF